ncbi:uncharacterized protein VTP21DRAFT_4552 [Calcarisporiella thermophila]|uniref:uncharacterized protein n=1 Tax=Calcarisporiella thermophila TaxID=911321 RepID=UPI00374254D0
MYLFFFSLEPDIGYKLTLDAFGEVFRREVFLSLSLMPGAIQIAKSSPAGSTVDSLSQKHGDAEGRRERSKERRGNARREGGDQGRTDASAVVHLAHSNRLFKAIMSLNHRPMKSRVAEAHRTKFGKYWISSTDSLWPPLAASRFFSILSLILLVRNLRAPCESPLSPFPARESCRLVRIPQPSLHLPLLPGPRAIPVISVPSRVVKGLAPLLSLA